MTSVYGLVRYRNVIGSSVTDRTAFDGSVPYSISCCARYTINNSGDSDATATTDFCVIGAPGDYAINPGDIPAGIKTGLAKQCSIRLRDIWVEVKSADSVIAGDLFGIAVYDPSSSYPDATAEHTHLYIGYLEDGVVRIPDIDGLVVSSGLNIGCLLNSRLPSNTSIHVTLHCVADIDD